MTICYDCKTLFILILNRSFGKLVCKCYPNKKLCTLKQPLIIISASFSKVKLKKKRVLNCCVLEWYYQRHRSSCIYFFLILTYSKHEMWSYCVRVGHASEKYEISIQIHIAISTQIKFPDNMLSTRGEMIKFKIMFILYRLTNLSMEDIWINIFRVSVG